MGRARLTGQSSAGFPTGWKDERTVEVVVSAIAKGDPIVMGVYGSFDTQLDKIPNPAVLPTVAPALRGTLDCCPTRNHFAYRDPVAVHVYAISDTDVISKLQTITPVSGSTSNVKFSYDGKYLLISSVYNATTTYLHLYEWSGTSYVSKKNVNYTGVTYGICWHPNNQCIYAAIGSSTSIIGVFDLSLVKQKDVEIQTTSLNLDLCCTPDGLTLFLLSNNYSYNNRWVNIPTDPFTGAYTPQGQNTANNHSFLDISNDGAFLIFGGASTDVSHIQYKDGAYWVDTAVSEPLSYGVSISKSSQYVGICYYNGSTPYFEIKKKASLSVFNKIANPSILPPGICMDIGFTYNDNYVVLALNVSPFLIVYRTTTKQVATKITKWSTNPLSWLPNSNNNIGMAKEAGAVGATIKVNLFPKLNTL